MNELERLLIFAALGALMGIALAVPPMQRMIAFSAFLAGIVCGVFGPRIIEWAWGPIPMFVSSALAILFGLLGIYIVSAILNVGRRFAADPKSFFDRIK